MNEIDPLWETGRWLRYAREDLQVSELILESGRILRSSCFHAQQCAEKAIKGSLIFLQINFPRTHDIRTLCALLPEGWRLGEDSLEFSDLNDWAVEPRYPGDLPEATEQDARNAIEQARKVYDTTLEDLKSHGFIPEGEG